jgi:hypothetical protein
MAQGHHSAMKNCLIRWMAQGHLSEMKNCLIRSIEIQDRPGVGPWTPFITGIQGTSYHVTGLHPDREYFFRVRGHAGDVFGIFRITCPIFPS